MKLVELLNRANAVYDDGYLANYYDAESGEYKLLEAGHSGDTLAEFIVIELSDTFDDEATDEAQLLEAERALMSAVQQLRAVVAAMHYEPPRVRNNHSLFNGLLLTDVLVPEDAVASLDDETYWLVYNWAEAEIYAANDNDVVVPPRPAWVDQFPKQPYNV